MADVEGLYIVTGVVLFALFAWVLVVLVRAPNAIDVSKAPAPLPLPAEAAKAVADVEDNSPAVVESRPSTPAEATPAAIVKARDSSPAHVEAPVEVSVTPPPTVTSTHPDTVDSAPSAKSDPAPVLKSDPAPAAKSARMHTMLGLAAPEPIVPLGVAPISVVPPARSRLDSHLEIQDSPKSATVVLMPEEGTSATGLDPYVLVTAVGLSDPLPGKSAESHAIFDRHHLMVFADGGGKRAGEELASAIVVDALVEAFEKDTPPAGEDPKLPERAHRIRQAALAANRRLLHRARESGYAGMGTSMLAAYFSPDHRELYVAHVGASRAYCVRDGHLTRLTTPHGARTLGVIDRVEVEVVEEIVRSGDLYLFCSDALGRALSESELLDSVGAEPSMDGLTRRLVHDARAKDDAQSLVAIAVRVEPAAELPKKPRQKAKTVLGLG